MTTRITIRLPDYEVPAAKKTDLAETLARDIAGWVATKDNGPGEPAEDKPEVRVHVRSEPADAGPDDQRRRYSAVSVTMPGYQVVDADNEDLIETLQARITDWICLNETDPATPADELYRVEVETRVDA